MTRRHLAYNIIRNPVTGEIIDRELINTGKDYSPKLEPWYPGKVAMTATRHIKGHGDTTSRRIRTVRKRILEAVAERTRIIVEG